METFSKLESRMHLFLKPISSKVSMNIQSKEISTKFKASEEQAQEEVVKEAILHNLKAQQPISSSPRVKSIQVEEYQSQLFCHSAVLIQN